MCVAGRPEFWNGTWSQVSTLCVLCYPWLDMGGGEKSLAKQSEPGYHESGLSESEYKSDPP